MNEKHLWELWAKCKHPHPEYGGGDMVWPMEFAELIIQECAGVAEQERLYQTSDLIKRHFGVK